MFSVVIGDFNFVTLYNITFCVFLTEDVFNVVRDKVDFYFCSFVGSFECNLKAEGTLEELRSGEIGASLEELFLELTEDGGEEA